MTRLQDIIQETRAETPEEDEEAAEAEEAETTPETPDDDDAHVTPPAPPDVDPKAIEKEAARHERALAKIMGAAWEGAQPCEKCGALGYLPPGFEPEPQLTMNPLMVECHDCDGYGFLALPTKNPQYQQEPCVTCSGRGCVDRATYERSQPPAAPQPFAGAPMPPPQPQWDQARGIWVDQFGTAIGNVTQLHPYPPNGSGTP
jgi:hypothetical protein